MKNCLTIFRKFQGLLFLAILVFNLFRAGAVEADDYISTSDVAGITLASGSIGLLGNVIKNNRTNTGQSGWVKPLPGEEKLMSLLGGKYYPGKTNFLDTRFGSVATSVTAVPLLVGINLKWPRNEQGKDIAQDLFLLSTGLLATNGVTELFKGIFRRERPCISLSQNNTNETDRTSNNNHAFNVQSFFSGHSSLAFYTVTYLNLRMRDGMRQNLSAGDYRTWSWVSPTVLYGWAAYVGWSRIHSYKHYPSDVLVGALVGGLIAELFYSFNDKIATQNNPYSNSSKKILFKISISF